VGKPTPRPPGWRCLLKESKTCNNWIMETEITQDTNQRTFASEPWFVDLLAGKGFVKCSENTFSNGKASIRLDGSHFAASPGVGNCVYKADFGEANRKTVTVMVEQILKMRPFRTDAEQAEERAEKRSVDLALGGIALAVRDEPHSACGVQLRRFLWSLYNMHHLVNLWRLAAELDHERAAWVAEVLAGAASGLVKDADLTRTLQTAGEMDRWEKEQPEDEVLVRLQEAEDLVTGLVRRIPPSRGHTVLASLQRNIAEAQSELREAGRAPR